MPQFILALFKNRGSALRHEVKFMLSFELERTTVYSRAGHSTQLCANWKAAVTAMRLRCLQRSLTRGRETRDCRCRVLEYRSREEGMAWDWRRVRKLMLWKDGIGLAGMATTTVLRRRLLRGQVVVDLPQRSRIPRRQLLVQLGFRPNFRPGFRLDANLNDSISINFDLSSFFSSVVIFCSSSSFSL